MPGISNRNLITLARQSLIDFWNNKKTNVQTKSTNETASFNSATSYPTVRTNTVIRPSYNQVTHTLYSTTAYGSNKSKAQWKVKLVAPQVERKKKTIFSSIFTLLNLYKTDLIMYRFDISLKSEINSQQKDKKQKRKILDDWTDNSQSSFINVSQLFSPLK